MTDLYTEILNMLEEGLRILNDVGYRFLGIILLYLVLVSAFALIVMLNRFLEWAKLKVKKVLQE